jgi:hypothetical protein
MLNSTTSVWLGTLFVLIGAINVCLILQASAPVKDAKASARLIGAHRIGGYLFILLFCVMAYFMVARLGDGGANGSARTIVHLTLAMVLSPLLFVKVLVARYYKNHYSILLPIGLMIFVLAFVLIGVTAGPYFVRETRIQTVSLADIDLPPAAIDINLAAATMEKRCSKCHNLDRIAGARKDARGWLATVNRMRALPDSGISEADSRIIVSYLASQMAPKGPAGEASLEVARATVDQRCGRCHSLDRVYQTVQTPEDWIATVTRMAGYAAGSAGAFQPGEERAIIAYLSATQTLEAVDRRKGQAQAASFDRRGMVTPIVASVADQNANRNRYGVKTIGFFSFLAMIVLTLVMRRPQELASPVRNQREVPE